MAKTLTEFDGFRIRNAATTKAELVKAGKTAEELSAAMGEALKLDGDKLTLLLAALDVAEGRQASLKRVVVYAPEEGKPAPSGAIEKDGKYFLAEFFYVPQAQPKRHGRGDERGERKGKGRGKRGRGGDRGRDERRGRGPRPTGAPGEQPQAAAGAPAGEKSGEGRPEGDRSRRRRRRPPRGPRPEGKAAAPNAEGGEKKPAAKPNVKPNVVPNVKPVTQPAAASTDQPKEPASS
jgi:hypothetical protein